MGPNYVLDKGFNLSNAGAAQAIYRFMKFATETTVLQQTAATIFTVGVCQDRIEAADSATGNAQVNVRMLGISKVEVGVFTGIVLGAEIMTDASGRALLAATAGNKVVGIALQPAAANGEWIDVLLTPNGRTL
jgi:hypothetical protein